jgi:hypothetical protein
VYWSLGFSGNQNTPQSHELRLFRFRESDEAKLLNLDFAHAVDPSQTQLLVSQMDAARDHERIFDSALESAAFQPSISKTQLAQIVNAQPKSTWIDEIRARLQPNFAVDSPVIESVQDVRLFEEYEQRNILMLDCLRIARVTRNSSERIVKSILLPAGNANPI